MENSNFSIELYLIENKWKKEDTLWKKGTKTIRLYENNIMIALNHDPKIKHKHIITCDIPSNIYEANVIFFKCHLNYKLKDDK